MEGLPGDPVRRGSRRRLARVSRPEEIILWRHGRTHWNEIGRGQGHLDIPLDDTGRRQAQVAGPYLAALRPDAIVASDLSRAVETAAVAGTITGLPVIRDPRLREIHLGIMQGLTRAEARSRHPQETAAFEAGDSAAGGRESQETLVARAVPAALDADVQTLLVVSHGGTIRAILNSLLDIPRARWRDALGPLGNCRWSHVRRRGDGWQLLVHNTGPDLVPDDSALTAQDTEPAR